MKDETIIDLVEGLRDAICKPGVPYPMKGGGQVGDLTEAGIGIAEALHAIANSLSEVAEAVREHKEAHEALRPHWQSGLAGQ